MDALITALLGAALALGLIAVVRRRGTRSEMVVYACGLSVAAGLYVLFAVAYVSPHWLMLETAGFLLFTGFAWLGFRRSTSLLAAGWAFHVAWDVLLHGPQGAPYPPEWYPEVCVGFDLVLAAYIFRWLDGHRV
ncbi:MAG: hypothetical protein OEQ13_02880 [Acidobacteriota bacterium]|nr:hypothetical protein [Acidobacteriota bacterium]